MVFTAAHRAEATASDRHWLPKAILRVLTIITSLIGIGAIAWVTDELTRRNSTRRYGGFSGYGYWLADDGTWVVWALIPFCVTVFYSGTILTHLTLRRKPSHPGALVGIDLVLWLSYVCVGTMVLLPTLFTLRFADQLPDALDGYSYGPGIGPDGRYYREDEYVCEGDEECTAMAREIKAFAGQVGRVEMLGAVCCFLALVLHFTLFVWACVDTNRHNRARASREAVAMAEHIVARFRETGTWGPMPDSVLQAVPHAMRQPMGQQPQAPYSTENGAAVGAAGKPEVMERYV